MTAKSSDDTARMERLDAQHPELAAALDLLTDRELKLFRRAIQRYQRGNQAAFDTFAAVSPSGAEIAAVFCERFLTATRQPNEVNQ